MQYRQPSAGPLTDQTRDEAVLNGHQNHSINDTTSAFGQVAAVTGLAYASYGACVGVRWWW